MKHITTTLIVLSLVTVSPSLFADSASSKTNKLLYMYRFYYLPFSVEFEQGRTADEILPFFPEVAPNPSRLLTADELKVLDKEWNEIKKGWIQKTLLESTKVALDLSVRIAQHLVSHRIPLRRSAFDRIPIEEQIQFRDTLKKKTPEVQASFRQIMFLKSFLTPAELEKFNFFIIGASWCNSSREYRILFEAFAKKFADPNYVLHSVVVDDPKEKIFNSSLLKELFPHSVRYTHDNIPRFLSFQVVNGKTIVLEEGEALKELYDRFFRKHSGYLNSKTTLFKDVNPNSQENVLAPALSTASK